MKKTNISTFSQKKINSWKKKNLTRKEMNFSIRDNYLDIKKIKRKDEVSIRTTISELEVNDYYPEIKLKPEKLIVRLLDYNLTEENVGPIIKKIVKNVSSDVSKLNFVTLDAEYNLTVPLGILRKLRIMLFQNSLWHIYFLQVRNLKTHYF